MAGARFASLSSPSAPVVRVSAAATAAPSPSPGEPAQTAAFESSGRGAILALARDGLLDSARAAAQKALASHPDDAFLLLLLGKLSASGQESSEYFKRAVQSGGMSAEAEEAQFRLGQYSYATGKYHLAIPAFRDYLRRHPQGGWRDPALYWMGNACLSFARSRPDRSAYLDSGAAWFRTLLDGTAPTQYYHHLALEGLAKTKASQGDRDGAWRAVEDALEGSPPEERPPLLLLGAQTRQGVDRAAEKSMMARLLDGFPQSPEARYLRKLNAGIDTSRWKSGGGFPRAPARPGSDSLAARPETAAASPPAVTPGAKPFTLQCGAFTQPANAQAMVATLAKLGLRPETVEQDRGGKRIYQVRVGRFANAEEAEAFAGDSLKPHRILSQPVIVNP